MRILAPAFFLLIGILSSRYGHSDLISGYASPLSLEFALASSKYTAFCFFAVSSMFKKTETEGIYSDFFAAVFWNLAGTVIAFAFFRERTSAECILMINVITSCILARPASIVGRNTLSLFMPVHFARRYWYLLLLAAQLGQGLTYAVILFMFLRRETTKIMFFVNQRQPCLENVGQVLQ